MSEESASKLPPHLKVLLSPTPSGTAKLLAAWDGLIIESQIELLLALNQDKHHSNLAKKILYKALDSPNAYIRYLAAIKMREITHNDEDEKILEERIAADPDDLVKYCLLENEWNFLDKDVNDPSSFFKLPHPARLAKVRKLRMGGENIAALITYGIENLLNQGKVSELELYEILSDFLISPSFRDFYGKESDHYELEYQQEKGLKALWQLIPKVPEKLSYVLLLNLPGQVGLVDHPLSPSTVLDQLQPLQIQTLLYRKDIELNEFRKQIFRKPAERLDDLRCAAISSNFDLTYREFSNILQKPDEEKFSILRDLTFAGDLSLVLYQALHDILNERKECDDNWDMGDDAERAITFMNHRAKELEGFQKQYQLTELKLYKCAGLAAPCKKGEDGYNPSGKLEFLAPLTVPGDTWKTFMNYSEEWGKGWSKQREELVKYLPRLFEIEDEVEQIKIEQEPISEWDQPLSRREFYNFHLIRKADFAQNTSALFGSLAIVFGGFIIWGLLTGNWETLGRDIGVGVIAVLIMVVFYKDYGRISSQQRKINKEKEES